MKPLVSIIIPARNEEKNIGKAIKSMLAQKYPRKEIIVMDNASTDKTAEIARSFNVKVIVNEKNIGYAKSVNKGIKLTKGSYIILLHSDHYTRDKEWIKKMITPLSDKSIGAVISQRLNKQRGKMKFAEKLFDSLSRMERNDTKKLKEVSTLREKCDAYRKSVIKKMGYFDISYPHGGEDIDMSMKMHKAGYKIVLSHNAVVEHLFSSGQNSMMTVFKKCLEMGEAGTILYNRYKIDALRRRMLSMILFSILLIPFAFSVLGLVIYSLIFFLGIFSTITIVNKKIPISLVSLSISTLAYIYTNSLFSISIGIVLTHLLILSYYGVHSVRNSMREGDKIFYLPFIFILSIVCRFLFAIGYLKEYVMPSGE